MSPEQPSSTATAPMGMIVELLGELRAGHDGLTEFVEQLTAELDVVRGQLAQTEQRLETERQEHARHCEELIHCCQEATDATPASDEEGQRRAEEWDQRRLALEMELAETRINSEAWQQQRAVLENELQAAQQQLAQWQQDKTNLENELEAASRQVGTWHAERATLETELGSLRQQVLQWERDRRAAESEISQLQAAQGESASWQHDRAALVDELETLRRHAAEWQQERAMLETELEAVRARAAEMAQTVAEQKRQMAEERAEWTGELKHLRRVLEKQAESLSQRAQEAQAAAAAVARHNESPANGTKASDPVLGSVMAQFEMLQRDVHRRRGQTH